MDIEIHKLTRIRDYAKRVFYQPEYTKELKLTNVKNPLIHRFDSAVKQINGVIKVRGPKLISLLVLNWGTTYTFAVFFCQNTYVAYLALVPQTVTLGEVVAMVFAANNLRGNLNGILHAINKVREMSIYAASCRKLMDYKPEIIACDPVETNLDIVLPKDIRFENVSFRYAEHSPEVIKNVSFVIKPNEQIAIVGHNGAGKSTLIKLLFRLLEPTSGNIFYGGINIKHFEPNEYRRIFGAVFQDCQLFAVSVADNVFMGEAYTLDDDRMNKALAATQMLEKVRGMNKGANTMLTREFDDEGELLSGGQLQRLAISRLFTRDFAVAVLDEPSSSLDPFAEYELNKSMAQVSENKTILFISHRLSTTVMSDSIYHFEHGELIESGSHNELMSLNGKYARMFNMQAEKYQ